jgi:hypothetical protein
MIAGIGSAFQLMGGGRIQYPFKLVAGILEFGQELFCRHASFFGAGASVVEQPAEASLDVFAE